MLKLKKITKDYQTSNFVTHALKGVSLNFRKSEFVSILGPSGCGKTTLLNIIGGLDRYTTGDLFIKDISTKDYKDRDWDTYRNHSIGFVFQSYNLIMHQNVLGNVELALTISGVNKTNRKKAALNALEKVGLKNEAYKMPNQLSGGQMQRVAIARALVNNPEILLADEPTGALDSVTSVQIMEILKEVSKDRLVIMVTHNPTLASQYSDRIIKLSDGLVIEDSNPYEEETNKQEIKVQKDDKRKKASMSFLTALTLSFKNLWTKKGRTTLIAMAGSIGIIGIALILSLSDGFNDYIYQVQSDTLSEYPITIQESTVSMYNAGMPGFDEPTGDAYPDSDEITQSDFVTQRLEDLTATLGENDLKSFKEYLDSDAYKDTYSQYTNGIQYVYDTDLNVFSSDGSGGYDCVYPIDYSFIADSDPGNPMVQMVVMMLDSFDVYNELLDNPELLSTQYDLLEGTLPSNANEAVVIVDKYNRIDDYVLYGMGLKDPHELIDIINGNELDPFSISFSDMIGLEYQLPVSADTYVEDTVSDLYSSNGFQTNVIEDAPTLKISGIIRPSKEATSTMLSSGIGYTKDLTSLLIDDVNESEVVISQKDNPDYCMIDITKTGLKLTWEQIQAIPDVSFLSYDFMMKDILHVTSLDTPSAIYIYPLSFEDKEQIVYMINEYNDSVAEAQKITYVDAVDTLMSSVTLIINSVTYVLIAFVSISLIVSSIMIGIITYVSVIERTKEIGVLRSLGASKKDVSNVFNAETIIIGITAGTIGVVVTILLIIPLNLIITALAGIPAIAILKWYWAFALIAISMILTLIAGLIPARMAAKKDPVIALRSGD